MIHWLCNRIVARQLVDNDRCMVEFCPLLATECDMRGSRVFAWYHPNLELQPLVFASGNLLSSVDHTHHIHIILIQRLLFCLVTATSSPAIRAKAAALAYHALDGSRGWNTLTEKQRQLVE